MTVRPRSRSTDHSPAPVPLPEIVRPEDGGDALRWAGQHRDEIRRRILTAGALLFRGFDITSVERFHALVTAISTDPLEYREQSSPRSRVAANVYTSTDYPPRYPIFLHNENSYAARWPMLLFFYCDQPAAERGETPIADCRRITAALDPAVRDAFATRQIRYVRNFGSGLGLDWRRVFGTQDRAAVEGYCAGEGIELEWGDGDRLRTWQRRPAFRRHPATGEELWFNHATFFHVSTLPAEIRDMLLAALPPEELPSNAFYGDGSPIESETLEHLRSLYTSETVTFPWQRGDVLLLDNMLVAHGRSPYAGERRILVAMTEATGGAPPAG